MKIELRKDNVVKNVDSEDRAKALMAKGFVRTDGKGAGKVKAANSGKELAEVQAKLADTQAKLEEASKYAEEADKKIDSLTLELEGTKEQLEAAVKANTTGKASAKK
ncbi:MAG: hypothetical protein LUG91_09855 [Ruminococcus sp.]|nr:hypothetical protein [Ruminococcus sp.]